MSPQEYYLMVEDKFLNARRESGITNREYLELVALAEE